MSQALVINSLHRSPWRDKPFSSGRTVDLYIKEYLSQWKNLSLYELVLPGESGYFPEARSVSVENRNDRLIESLRDISSEYERLVYFWSDTPFLDMDLTEKLLDLHHRYLSHFTFSDGWPLGLTPEIIGADALEKLLPLSRGDDKPVGRDSLFSLIQKDINDFDLETLIAPEDFRLLRLVLAADGKDRWTVLDRFDREGLIDGVSIRGKLSQRQDLLRTVPSFYQIQITEKRAQKPEYLPVPDFSSEKEMTLSDFDALLKKMAALSPEGVISLSYWCEPSLHGNIYEMMEHILSYDSLTLLVETSGIGWDRDKVGQLLRAHQDRMIWIVEIDASDPALYQRLRGEGQEEALSFIEFLGSEILGDFYVQTTRLIENEDHLEALFHEWKEKPGNLIIKKYDHFCGLLPQRKVTDLSPITRMPCWHLKRDMVILSDGTVLPCQEHLDSRFCLGNGLKEDLEEIWKRGKEPYLGQLDNRYVGLCERCDEYYTYNF